MTPAINQLVLRISEKLKAREWKLVTTESCTGGGLAYCFTELSGSSDWFERGFVSYSNSAKEELLGVSPQTLANHGAVSRETAQEMAEGALRNSQAQISISITGIAGPTGGTKEKPVGTIWIGYAGINLATQCTLLSLTGNRTEIRMQTIETALENLLRLLVI